MQRHYTDEEIAFQKTTVHQESTEPFWEQQFTLPVPDASECFYSGGYVCCKESSMCNGNTSEQ